MKNKIELIILALVLIIVTIGVTHTYTFEEAGSYSGSLYHLRHTGNVKIVNGTIYYTSNSSDMQEIECYALGKLSQRYKIHINTQ